MKKILFSILLISFLWVANAFALPVLTADVDNQLFFNNVENVYEVTKDTDGNFVSWTIKDPDATDSQIVIGDAFVGIFKVQNIEAPAGIDTWNQDGILPDIDQLTGYFAIEVIDIDPGVDGAPDTVYFSQLSFADPNGILDTSNGEAMAFFTDDTDIAGNPGTVYEANGPVAQDIPLATDGDLWATIGFTGTNNYWYASTSIDFEPIGGANTIAEGFGGLDFIQNNTGFLFTLVNDPNEGAVNTDVEIFFQTEIQRTAGSQADSWDFLSNDPAEFTPAVVPEPSTFALLGFALLSFAAIGRRKN